MKTEVQLPVTLMGKPRMTQRDKWAHRPVIDKYYSLCDLLRYEAQSRKFVLPDVYHAEVYIEMPKSWSLKKRAIMEGQPHQQKPDKDNLEKMLMDALRPGDDEKIWDSRVTKYWSEKARVVISY